MIRIITDSTCSLSQDLSKELNIKTATFSFTLDGDEIEDDGSVIKTDEFYSILEMTEDIGPLKAPAPEKYEKLFADGVKNGDEDFIVITMSAKNGESYDSAIRARESFLSNTRIAGIRIAIIDSRSMSSGYGYLVMKIAKLRDDGLSYEDIVEYAERYKSRIKGYTCVSDAVSLADMGFLKTSTRKIRKSSDNIVMLSTDSKGMGVVMGNAERIEQVYRTYADDFIQLVDRELTDFIIIEYSSDVSRAEDQKKYLIRTTGYEGEIYLSQLSPSGGVILGLGSVGMSYVSKSSSDSFGDLFRRAGRVTKTS